MSEFGNKIKQAEDFIGNVYTNNKRGDTVRVIGGYRQGGYLWLECECCDCKEKLEKPIRHTNLEHGKFICPYCHPDNEFAYCNIGDSQPYRFNITQKNNTSGYVGVDYVKSQKKWRARLNYNKQCYDLGRFDTAEEAHEARERKRHELGLVDMNKFTKGE